MLKNLGNMTLSETLEHETKKTGIGKFWAIRHHCSETLNDLKAYPCKLCGYSLHVELCHVKAIHRCFKETPHMLVKEVNSRANVIPLCRNCHWELDNGHIQMKE